MKPQCKIKTQHSDSRHQEVCLGQAPHTPTPWYTDSEWGFYCPSKNHDSQDIDEKVFEATNEADAVFIVRAVNCHEDFIELAKAVLENRLSMTMERKAEIRDMARNAIAKAEAK